jgi:hypothetical protein
LLTLRQMVAPLTRKTWSLPQSPEHLVRHVEWARAYYHFSRVHSSLTVGTAIPKAQRERTPAMAAGLTDHRWRVLELLSTPLVADTCACACASPCTSQLARPGHCRLPTG